MSNNDEWQVVGKPNRRNSVSKDPPKSSTTRKNNKSSQNVYQPPRSRDDNKDERKGRSESRDKFDSKRGKPQDDRRSRTDKRDTGPQNRGPNRSNPNDQPSAVEDEVDLAIPIPKPVPKQPAQDPKVWVVTKADAKGAPQDARHMRAKPQEAANSGFHALADLDDEEEDDLESPLHRAAPAEQAAEDPISSWGNDRLQHNWVFWEHRGLPRGGGNDSSYHHSMGWVGECGTIGEFWQVFNHLPHPSKFFAAHKRPRGNVGGRLVEGWSLFRQGVQPEWEDPKNATGAEFQMSPDNLEDCDQWWTRLLLGMIGGTLPCSAELMGLRVIDKSKKGTPVYRIELWFTAETEHKPLRQGIAETLGHEPKFSLKQHSKQKEVTKAIAKAAKQPEGDSSGRVKELRALLAKLTPERFERLAPQVRGLMGDVSATSAAVQCVHTCTMQTSIFHSMYADLVDALQSVPGFQDQVMESCMKTLEERDEGGRLDAKNAASFTAQLCVRGIFAVGRMLQAIDNFGSGPVEVEVLCTLLKALRPMEQIVPQLAGTLKKLSDLEKSGTLDNRLKFMVQDIIGIYTPKSNSSQNKTRRK